MKPTAKSVARVAAIAWVFSLFAFLSLGSVCWVAENETVTALFGLALAAVWTASTGVLLALAAWHRPRLFATVLFAVTGVLLLGFFVQVFTSVHSEIPPEKTWELLTAPALRSSLFQAAALGFFLAGWAVLGTGAIRRNAGRRRRAAIAAVIVCLLGSLAAFVWAAGRANDLMLSGRVFETFDSDAYPGVIQLLGFRGHATLVGKPSFEAWIEFKAGNVASFTDRTPPAAPGGAAEALRAACAAFPRFRPDPSGRILAIRPDTKWKGWIVPGESPIRCVVLATRRSAADDSRAESAEFTETKSHVEAAESAETKSHAETAEDAEAKTHAESAESAED